MGGSAGRCGERFLDLAAPIQLCREKIQIDKASHTSLHTAPEVREAFPLRGSKRVVSSLDVPPEPRRARF